ncbi:PREDICTED: vacuolar iron transporter homolog 3-like [Ipomoea nil]|uniref:vacuolar iron transporter homolog 3-like n=1 Tax=Ipomoea nil TaxID=35883 RepID=UPI000900EFA4|nr:PREDICTED: vacuolar iron transporter homolog 3-like [Ipomoea nil]
MAASNHAFQQEPKHVVPNNGDDMEQQARSLDEEDKKGGFDYAKRAPWLRAAVLGANDGLVSIASLMMGVGTVKQDIKAMILTGFAGMVAGACSMAIGEFVSVYSQRDIEVAQMKRKKNRRNGEDAGEEEEEESDVDELPNPMQAAAASVVAFTMGAMVPLLAASFIKPYKVRIGAVIAAVTVALVVCGWLGAALGGAPKGKASVRVLIGGWLAMAITSGLTKLIGIKS